ncbi:MAG: conjugal transfer protein [Oscillospiraceae bacterium]|nr:conjugal transfer protein [Oscillospiraceae bacterium]
MDKAEKAAKTPVVKPYKDTEQKIRKKSGMIALRVVLWGFIGFIFLRGVITSVRPDTAGEALKVVRNFRTELSNVQMLDGEIQAFAEQFAVEYLTYVAGGEDDQRARLSRFAVTAVIDAANSRLAKGSSSAPLYVNAYRKEAYSDTQYDVYVAALVQYTRQGDKDDDGEIPIITESQRATLRIPVAFDNNRYIIEGTPQFVNDDVKWHEYEVEAFSGKEVSDNKRKELSAFLNDFFKAYYEENQGLVDVFLDPNADKSGMQGLSGLLTFDKIDGGLMYHTENANELIALMTLYVTDRNDNQVQQNFTVSLIEQDGRFFVSRLDTRINNLNIGG